MITRPSRRGQRGIILVTGLLFLVILTLLGLSLFRSTGLMDRISANTRDKQRSFETAQAALQYGEWWLGQGTSNTNPVACSTLDVSSNLHVCSNAISATLATDSLPFPAGYKYTPANLTVSSSGTGGGLVSGGGDVNYKAPPGLYIENKGLSTDGKSVVYQVSAYGFGGNADTGTVVRSTYKLTPAGGSLDGL